MKSFRQVVARLTEKNFLNKIADDEIFDLAASLAYYTALSLAPLLILLLSFVAFLGDQLKTELITEIESLVGSQAGVLIRTIASSSAKTPQLRDWGGVLGLLTLVFSAGAIFGQLRSSLNKIFEANTENADAKNQGLMQSSWSYLKQKIFSMGMVFAFVFISIVSLVISSVMSLFLTGMQAMVGQAINFTVSLVIFGFLFSAIYYFLPQKDVHPKIALLSGFITAVLFSIGKTLIGLYLGQSALASLYGAAGSFIVLLMWVYYSSAIIFVSAEIAYALNRKEEHEPGHSSV